MFLEKVLTSRASEQVAVLVQNDLDVWIRVQTYNLHCNVQRVSDSVDRSQASGCKAMKRRLQQWDPRKYRNMSRSKGRKGLKGTTSKRNEKKSLFLKRSCT